MHQLFNVFAANIVSIAAVIDWNFKNAQTNATFQKILVRVRRVVIS